MNLFLVWKPQLGTVHHPKIHGQWPNARRGDVVQINNRTYTAIRNTRLTNNVQVSHVRQQRARAGARMDSRSLGICGLLENYMLKPFPYPWKLSGDAHAMAVIVFFLQPAITQGHRDMTSADLNLSYTYVLQMENVNASFRLLRAGTLRNPLPINDSYSNVNATETNNIYFDDVTSVYYESSCNESGVNCVVVQINVTEHWMRLLRDDIGDLRLGEMPLPGSHDAMTRGCSNQSYLVDQTPTNLLIRSYFPEVTTVRSSERAQKRQRALEQVSWKNVNRSLV